MVDFRDAFFLFERIGVLEVLVPFLLIFTIIYAVLQKTKLLGKNEEGKPRKNFNVIIALVMALAVVIPHVTQQYANPDTDVVNIINGAIPNISLVAVAIIMGLLLIGVFGKELDIGNSSAGGFFIIFAFLIVAVIFLFAAGVFDRAYLPGWLYFLYDPQFQALIVAIIVFWGIIYFVTKEDKKKDKDDEGALMKLSKMLKEPK